MLHPSSRRASRRLPARAWLAGLVLSAFLCGAAHADGTAQPDVPRDAAHPRLFIAYGIAAADPVLGLPGVRASSVQGLQWREALLYNELHWQPSGSGRTLERGDTALVAPTPWQRTWLTLGDRRRDAGLLLPVRLAGIDLRSSAAFPVAPRPATLGTDAASAGEVDVRGNAIEIRSLRNALLVTPFADADDTRATWPSLPGPAGAVPVRGAPADRALVPEHVVDAIQVARPLAKGVDEFEYAMGAARSADGTAYGGTAFIAAHRLGISDALTLGAHALAHGEQMAAGLDGALALGSLGALDTGAGILRDAGAAGPMAVWRYALARGPLEVRARYRLMPADTATALEGPADAEAAVRDLSARVAYTLPDSRVLSVESRYAAWPQGPAQASMLVAYSLARTRRVDLEGRVGYAPSGDTGAAEAWMAGLSLRLALDAAGTAAAATCAQPAFARARCTTH
jgi:hypothetical protein